MSTSQIEDTGGGFLSGRTAWHGSVLVVECPEDFTLYLDHFMERISDTVTSLFHIAIKDNRPAVCSSSDGSIVWSDAFGLGWRLGISYVPNQHEWFAKARFYLDHNHSHTEQDQATIVISLKDAADQSANGLTERLIRIINFGHDRPALIGSWTMFELAGHPYVSLTLTAKARLPQPAMDPLSSASLAIRKSMVSGDFVDTKFYVFSTKRRGNTASKPRVVYANSDSLGLALPRSSSREKHALNGPVNPFLRHMTGDQHIHINENSILRDYAYEQDSDLDDEEELEDSLDGAEHQQNYGHSKFQTSFSLKRSPSKSSTQGDTRDSMETLVEPPAYSISACRMILVKDVAYRTWLSYIYFRYTGQVYFLPLKSADQGSSRVRSYNASQPPSCSPKSMYRLATSIGDERMQELALRAIKEGLSKNNIVDEAFSWFTAQYPTMIMHAVDRMADLRKLPEVSSVLKLQMKAVSHGQKPWAHEVLVSIMEKLTN